MTTNPYLDAVNARMAERVDPFPDAHTASLAPLAIAHELARMNDLTEALNAPLRVITNPGGLDAAAKRVNDAVAGRVIAVPDEAEGDRRIAAAARRWAELYARRNETAAAAGYYLSCSELAGVVRQEGER